MLGKEVVLIEEVLQDKDVQGEGGKDCQDREESKSIRGLWGLTLL